MEEKAKTVIENMENANPTKKAGKPKSTKSQRSPSSHPRTSEMVNAAIKELKDRKGSSFQAIKKYISLTYKVDGEKLAPFIKRYLKAAVTSGIVVQTKGKGASGSFKLSTKGSIKGSDSKKIHRTIKVSKSEKVKKSVEKKTSPLRKPVSSKKLSSPKKAERTKKSTNVKKSKIKTTQKTEKVKFINESKTISKSKKTTKAPAAKTKTPKPKKSVANKTIKSTGKK